MRERSLMADIDPFSVLVVEDDRAYSAYLSRKLSRTAAGPVAENVQVARSLSQAREFLETGEFAVVLLDVNLPDGSGLDLIGEWSDRDHAPAFIVVTAHSNLENASRAIGLGAYDFLVKGELDDFELQKSMSFALYRRRQMMVLKEMASSDKLTGLRNRIYLNETLARERHRFENSGRPFAVAYIDLDKFKQVNDTYGHSAGDIVLKTVARRITNGLRKSDTASRLGGDELVLVIQDVDHARAEIVIRHVYERIVQPVDIGGSEVAVGASIGVAVYPLDGSSPEGVLALADERMYEAKRSGGGIALRSEEQNAAG